MAVCGIDVDAKVINHTSTVTLSRQGCHPNLNLEVNPLTDGCPALTSWGERWHVGAYENVKRF